MTTSRPPELRGLTLLRFFAAMYVVLYHYGLAPLAGVAPALVPFVGNGYSAVSIFFALSGFILVHTYVDERGGLRTSLRTYAAARVARLLPVMFLAWVLVAPYCIGTIWRQSDGAAAAASAVLLASGAGALMLQAWLPTLALSWNFSAWSVSAEMFFYALFPWLAPWLARLSSRRLTLAAAGFWVTGLLGPAWYIHAEPDGVATLDPISNPFWAAFVRYNPLMHLGTFGLGAAAAIYRRRLRGGSTPLRATVGWAALAAMLAVLTAAPGQTFLFLHNGLLTPLFALFLALATRASAVPLRGLGEHLGKASYSIYLLQMPVFVGMRLALGRLPANLLELALGVAALVGLALLTYRWIEAPGRRWLMARLASPPRSASPAPILLDRRGA